MFSFSSFWFFTIKHACLVQNIALGTFFYLALLFWTGYSIMFDPRLGSRHSCKLSPLHLEVWRLIVFCEFSSNQPNLFIFIFKCYFVILEQGLPIVISRWHCNHHIHRPIRNHWFRGSSWFQEFKWKIGSLSTLPIFCGIIAQRWAGFHRRTCAQLGAFGLQTWIRHVRHVPKISMLQLSPRPNMVWRMNWLPITSPVFRNCRQE